MITTEIQRCGATLLVGVSDDLDAAAVPILQQALDQVTQLLTASEYPGREHLLAAPDTRDSVDDEPHTLHEVRAHEHHGVRRHTSRREDRRHTTDPHPDQQVPQALRVLPGHRGTCAVHLRGHGVPGVGRQSALRPASQPLSVSNRHAAIPASRSDLANTAPRRYFPCRS
ncbi:MULTISPECIES: hypothetical protein [unclassified Streptomyces]|uniref:hypothetical protein n=1 Tax=unclassified Streptomyces TaxID=2593676 RepID=UPI002E2E27BA|nr:hypothetical protein [Streptomyces sp. NBC_01439]